jgi:SlyX protein
MHLPVPFQHLHPVSAGRFANVGIWRTTSAPRRTDTSGEDTMSEQAPMNKQILAERIDALESRLAYQDDTIETLNRTVTEQWQQIDALKRQVAGLAQRVQEAEASARDRTADEPPPHY